MERNGRTGRPPALSTPAVQWLHRWAMEKCSRLAKKRASSPARAAAMRGAPVDRSSDASMWAAMASKPAGVTRKLRRPSSANSSVGSRWAGSSMITDALPGRKKARAPSGSRLSIGL